MQLELGQKGKKELWTEGGGGGTGIFGDEGRSVPWKACMHRPLTVTGHVGKCTSQWKYSVSFNESSQTSANKPEGLHTTRWFIAVRVRQNALYMMRNLNNLFKLLQLLPCIIGSTSVLCMARGKAALASLKFSASREPDSASRRIFHKTSRNCFLFAYVSGKAFSSPTALILRAVRLTGRSKILRGEEKKDGHNWRYGFQKTINRLNRT